MTPNYLIPDAMRFAPGDKDTGRRHPTIDTIAEFLEEGRFSEDDLTFFLVLTHVFWDHHPGDLIAQSARRLGRGTNPNTHQETAP